MSNDELLAALQATDDMITERLDAIRANAIAQCTASVALLHAPIKSLQLSCRKSSAKPFFHTVKMKEPKYGRKAAQA